MKQERKVTLGISEKVGWLLYKLCDSQSFIEKFRYYLSGLYRHNIEELIIIVGGGWRHKFIRSIINLDLDIELIILHNFEWMRGSGTILLSLSQIVNNDIVLMYNALAKYSVIKQLLKGESYLFGVSDEDGMVEIFPEEPKLMVRCDEYIFPNRNGKMMISGPFMLRKEIFSLVRKFEMVYDKIELTDILKAVLLKHKVKPFYICKDDIIPLARLTY